MAKRGSLIVFEGLDRTGKSTQCKLLEQSMKKSGKLVEIMRFPDRTTPIGKMIDSYLRQDSELDDHAIHLLFAANRWEKSKQIRTAIESGTTIICDRYAFSGTAFTAAKMRLKEGVEEEEESFNIERLTSADMGLPLPDLVIFLTLDDQSAASQREGFGLERYENQSLQQEVARQFTNFVHPFFLKNHAQSCSWVNIDATPSIDIVKDNVATIVNQFLSKSPALNLPIGKLWLLS